MERKRVSLLLAGSLLAVSLTLSGAVHRQACAAPVRGGPGVGAVEGAVVTGNKVTLKKGYQFVRLSEKEVAIQNIATGTEAARFSCECPKRGSCRPQIGKDTIKCVGTCRGGCEVWVSGGGTPKVEEPGGGLE